MPGPIFYYVGTPPNDSISSAEIVDGIASAESAAAANPSMYSTYGTARPHVDGKMAPPGLPWVGKLKGRKRK